MNFGNELAARLAMDLTRTMLELATGPNRVMQSSVRETAIALWRQNYLDMREILEQQSEK